jgi:hypothetical protein
MQLELFNIEPDLRLFKLRRAIELDFDDVFFKPYSFSKIEKIAKIYKVGPGTVLDQFDLVVLTGC